MPASILHYWAREESLGMLVVLGVVGVYVAVVPSITPVTSLGIYNEKRVLQIAILGVAGCVLLLSRDSRREWLTTFRTIPFMARLGLGVVLALGIISAAQAPASGSAFLEVGHFVLLFLLAGIVAAVARHSPRRTGALILGTVVLSALLYAVHFSVSYGVYLLLPELEVGRQTLSGFGNVRFLNQYQTWTLPLLGGIVLAIPSRHRIARAVVFGLVVLWWTFIFASMVRGTLVADLIAFGIVGLLFGRRAVRFIGVQGAGLVMGFGLYLLLFSWGDGGSTVFAEEIDRSGSVFLRLNHWQICLEMVTAHPFLGAGPMHYAWPPINFMPPASPHSAFFQWLGEWGIPSTLIMGSLTVWSGWRWIQQERTAAIFADSRSNAVRVALVASVLAGAAHAKVSGLIVTPVSQVLLVLVGGWAWGRYRHAKSSSAVPTTSAHVALCVLLVAAVAIVGGRSAYDLSVADERQSAFAEAGDHGRYSPRYWTQGYLQVRDSSVVERARREME